MIFNWLTRFGLELEVDDLHPITDWESNPSAGSGDFIFAGRFGQWKYQWSDDCDLRGKQLGKL